MRKHLLVLLMLCVAGIGTVWAAETEPNNTKAQANALSLFGSNTGDIDLAGDEDWWQVTTTGDGKLDITIAVSNNLFMWCQIYDNDGATLLVQGYTASTNTYIKDGLAAGTYYIRVFPYYTGELPAYTISNNLTQPLQANDAEPNNTKSQAKVLPLNGSKTGHNNYYYNNIKDTFDWYKVTTNADGRLRLTMSSGNGQNLWAYLYDNDGTTLLASGYTAGTAFVVNKDGLAAGTYYIRVNTYYNSEWAPYTLSDSLFTPTQPNDTEPNNTKALALALPLNGSKTGHSNYYYNNIKDTFDWYKVTTNADGRLRLTMSSGNGQNLWAYLYDNDGTTLLASGYTAGTAFVVNKDGLAAGTYYIRVNTYYNYEWAPYTLSDSLFTPTQPNDTEPNATVEEAITLPLNGSQQGHINYYYNNKKDSADWYKITANTDGRLRLTMTSGNGQNVWAELFDTDGTSLIAASYTTSTGIVVDVDGLKAGIYYIRVRTYYNSEWAPYTLANTLTTYTNATDTEPNEFYTQAKTIPANGSVTGHVSFYGNGSRDNVDIFKINYTGSGNMTLNFIQENRQKFGSAPPTWLQVYRDTTAAPIFSNYFYSTSGNINLSLLTQGYYYVRIFTFYNNNFNDFSSYSVSNSFTQVNIANITITQAINGSCTSGQLQMQGNGSKPPYTVNLYRFGVLYNTYISNDTTGFTASNLPPGIYYATAFGDGATGSAFGTSNTRNLLPPATTTSSESNITSSAATVKYVKVICANGYVVQWRRQGTTPWSQKIILGNKDSLRITGLLPATTYQWRVAVGVGLDTLTNYVLSAFSAIDQFTTLGSMMAAKSGNTESSSLVTGNRLLIAPNPATDFFTIKYNGAIPGKINWILTDMNGRVVQTNQVDAIQLNSTRIYTNALTTGIYQLQLRGADGVIIATEKVIVQR